MLLCIIVQKLFRAQGGVVSPEQKKVKEFHEKYGYLSADKPNWPDPEVLLTRIRLIITEAGELADALSTRDMVEAADGLADLLVVVYGTADVLGLDMEPIFNEIHRSNMSKEGGFDSGGKIQKGDSFVQPDVAGELAKQGWG